MPNDATDKSLDQAEIARRRDETIRRMINMPAKTQKGQPKRAPKQPAKK